MIVTKEIIEALRTGETSGPVAVWTHKGDLIVGIYPQGDTYELIMELLLREAL
jgi:hypothetical protein